MESVTSYTSSSTPNVSTNEAETNSAFRHSLFYLRFAGLWAENGQEPSRLSILTGQFAALVVIAIFVYQFTLLTEDTNGEVIAKFIAEFLGTKSSMLKILTIILIRKQILKIWLKTYEINSIPKALMEKEIADVWDRFQSKLVKLLSRFYIGSIIFYITVPWINGSRFPVKGTYPEWAKTSPCFYLVYTVTLVATMLRGVTVISCDLCSVIAMCRIFRELQLVQHLIGELKKNNRRALRDVLIRHALILDYGRMIRDNFSTVLILQHVDMSMSICILGAVSLYTNDLALIMNLMLFIMSYASQLAIICYIGETLLQESKKVTSCIESSYDKFLTDVPSSKLLYMMLLRAQDPLKINFGSTNLSLSFYSQTINTIYSVFMVLKSLIQ